ncbi:MAG: sigma-54-dependent Fis family transcriptional regulator [Gammaproteobacteria bacterium]|nr:MAG: sigma-54-dependent Fis family transcriptional regulator [Gammaproteobacteria bacterium]
MSAPHILVVDDEPDIRELVREILEEEGYQVSVAEDAEAARRARRARRPDLILLDIWMPDTDGISLLKEWSEEGGGLACPVIVMSGHGTVETAVEATRLGAYDFLEKPLSMAKLLLTVERALEAARLRRENVALRRHARPLEEPLGRSPVMQALREQLRRVAQHDAWVLISGEPGSGKELCARYLHAHSPRREGPFVEVGVAALVGENAAVELFGAEEAGGRVRYGLLEQARGGTLFLDEVGDMDLAVQARLFGALESGAFLRVGGTEPVPLDVRIVAATHRDLAEEVRRRRFREDLYYKLNVVPLRVPALREHSEDVPELLAHYVDDFVAREGLGYRRFTVAAQNFLRHYPWPGNVRELKNLVQRLLILGAEPEIDVEEVKAVLGTAPERPRDPVLGPGFELPLREARERFERAYLEHHLRQAGGSVGKAAKAVGLERTHLYRKLKALGLEPRELAARSREGD